MVPNINSGSSQIVIGLAFPNQINDMYITNAVPKRAAQGIPETVMHIACNGAAGQTSDVGIVNGIWGIDNNGIIESKYVYVVATILKKHYKICF